MLIHLQIPKTSTTSVVATLRDIHGERLRQVKLLADIAADGRAIVLGEGFAEAAAAEQALREAEPQADVLSVMAPFGAHRLLRAAACRYFTLLREPLERCVSYWNMECEKAARGLPFYRFLAESEYDFDDFSRRRIALSLDNEQTRMLAGTSNVTLTEADFDTARSNLETWFDVVGTVETHDASLDAMRRCYGWPVTASRRLNVGPEQPRRTLTPGQMDELRERNRFDLRLYEAARQGQFDRR